VGLCHYDHRGVSINKVSLKLIYFRLGLSKPPPYIFVFSYGDRSPRTTLGRLFAITWTLTGLVATSIMVGNLTSSLTVSVSTQAEKIIYGAKVCL
jgi:hypothetical protein